ncbi:MAG TPA: MFS transporter, partial [Kribbella sp.]|nr:MFS transporter [Kribbella sp.]
SMSDVKPEDAGLASGLIGTMGEVGAALGLAILATLSATHTAASTKSPLHALTDGYHFSFAVAAAIVAASVAIAATVMRPAKQSTATEDPKPELLCEAA